MKRLLSILLALVLTMAVAVPVMAETPAPVEMDITVSSVVVDAICGQEETTYVTGTDVVEEKVTWTRYDLESAVEIDTTIAGVAYENVNLRTLADAVVAKYYPDYDTTGTSLADVIHANINLEQSYENQLHVGTTYDCAILITFNNTEDLVVLAEIPVKLELCETKVESVSIAPFSYFAPNPHDGGLTVTTTWKDGSVQTGVPYDMHLQRVAELPTEIGTHTVIYTLGGLEIPAEVTVLDVPTSGQCGDNMNWSYDKDSYTLTISGTGDMYTIADSRDDFWDNKYGYEPAWWYLDVKNIVVEEGVERLSNFAFFHNYMSPESIQLPTSMKELPDWGFLVSTSVTSLTIPEGITSITGWPFGSPGNSFLSLTELYLPSTLAEMDIITIILSGLDPKEGGLTLQTIHFAGTEEQWNAINCVRSETMQSIMPVDDETYALYEEMFNGITVVFEPKEDVKEEVTVENGTATVPDSSVEITEGEDVVIDVTGTEEEVDSVVIGAETVDKIADAETAVEIKLPDATVSFDAAAIGSIGEQAGESAVTIVAKEVENTTLTAEQKAALEEKEVCAILNLEAFAGETKITDFGVGKVTISVPFELPEGKTGTDYYVAYVAEDGTITAMPTTYADGVLCFETTHFSSYVVLENKTVTPEPTPDPSNPQTGDNSHLLLFVALMVISAAALTVCLTKRRAF